MPLTFSLGAPRKKFSCGRAAALHFHARAGCGNVGEAQIGCAYVLEVDADGGHSGGRMLLDQLD